MSPNFSTTSRKRSASFQIELNVLPKQDHVARTCRKSTLDGGTGEPTPASFEFRAKDGQWQDAYLSVNWLEYLGDDLGDLQAKVARLRAFQLEHVGKLSLIKPTASNVFAVVPVERIQSANLADVGTTLDCRHEPSAERDPHSGIHPTPGVEGWSTDGNSPVQLAVQQFLFESICHTEKGIL